MREPRGAQFGPLNVPIQSCAQRFGLATLVRERQNLWAPCQGPRDVFILEVVTWNVSNLLFAILGVNKTHAVL